MEKTAFDSADILRQLKRLIESKSLGRSRKLRQMLKITVQAGLIGKSLKEYAVGVELGWGPEFDPRMNSIVRVLARRLRVRLKEYYSTEGSNDEIIVEYRRGSYSPTYSSRADVSARAASTLRACPHCHAVIDPATLPTVGELVAADACEIGTITEQQVGQ